MSVGVKGFRVGTGPRGNYIHMGRGGLYYRSSLGGPHPDNRATPSQSPHAGIPSMPATGYYARQQIETGNVLEMKPASGNDIVDQINEKMALFRLWPWALAVGGLATVLTMGNAPGLALAIALLTAVAAILLARWDQSRKAVVLMYDLDDHALATFKAFSDEFERVGSASRVWNVETAQRTADLKRNAGASQLISRQSTAFTQGVPSVVKTNVSIPAIVGGRQSLYFLPDVALVSDGKAVGAISYDQLRTYWSTTIYIEEDGVPSDSVVVGHTWRFVNKNGGPDRRFNNNRQIPRVQYQHMGLQGPGGFQKLLQISRVADRGSFDAALLALSTTVGQLKRLALAPPSAS